ncbi:MAG: hypothetical protein HY901_34375 [Deltaproteobacteria bacterium]|nr:hypothetical protein [Deltaproteobacteria bacterium]
MLLRFFIYGALGWCMEVIFTGVSSLLKHDRSATAKTYLWMHPIYGATALLLEGAHDLMSTAPWFARGFAYLAIIYAAEALSGWILRRVLGSCPWDYGRGPWSVAGLIRLDYAPAWYLAGLLFEPVRLLLAGLAKLPLRVAFP